MRTAPEYNLYRAIAYYLRLQYPGTLFHFDPTGLNLSKAQRGMLKAIQGPVGYPDLFIMEPRGPYHGLFIEVKPEGARLFTMKGEFASDHIKEQSEYLVKLSKLGYWACFACGFDEAIKIIKEYLG